VTHSLLVQDTPLLRAHNEVNLEENILATIGQAVDLTAIPQEPGVDLYGSLSDTLSHANSDKTLLARVETYLCDSKKDDPDKFNTFFQFNTGKKLVELNPSTIEHQISELTEDEKSAVLDTTKILSDQFQRVIQLLL
jgi:hypothetical protein